MSRNITVKGTGAVSVKPDLAVISLTVEKQKQKYEDALKAANSAINSLNESLWRVGFERDVLKTVNFDVDSVYESVKGRKGEYRREFSGYRCEYRLKMEFELDREILGKALKGISDSAAEPEISISFTVKDTDSVKADLLKRAAQNAKAKAEVLCEASGVKLGTLLNINYAWTEINIGSSFDSDAEIAGWCEEEEAYFEPNEIDVKDNVTFVWEII